jgi:hypothetical protein
MMVSEYWHDTRAAVATAGAAIGVGFASFLDIIPDDILKLSAMLGCILTVILIWNHARAKHLHAYQLSLEKQARDLHEAKRSMDKQHARLDALSEMLNKMKVG